MQFNTAGASWWVVMVLIAGCGDPKQTVPGDGGLDANSMLTPDPMDPKSTPCAGRLGFPGLPTIQRYSSASFVVVDVNVDGDQDIVSLARSGALSGIQIHLGNGDGTFRLGMFVTLPFNATVFEVADTSGDGRPDLLYGVPVGSDSDIRVAVNDGNGGFGAPQLYGASINVAEIHAVDVNGDSKRDLLVLGQNSGDVAVLLNSGGSFGAPQVYSAGSQNTSHLELADLTNDNRPEIMSTSGDAVNVLVNDGTGAFLPRVMYPAPYNSYAVAIGDLNEDGKPDVAVGTVDIGSHIRMTVLLNQGGGVLGAAQNFATNSLGTSPTSLAIADANGDGHLDVATGYNGTRSTNIFLGSGTGQLMSPLVIDLGRPVAKLTFADLNGDGRQDVLIGTNDQVTPILNNGTSSPFEIRPLHDFEGLGQIDTVRMLDLDGDSMLDLISLGETAFIPRLATRRGGSGGTFAPQVMLERPVSRGYTDAEADFDNDGRPDIVIADAMGQVLLNRGDGTLTAAAPFTLPQYATSIAVGDVNRDGLRDLVISTTTGTASGGTLQYLRGLGNGTFEPPSMVLSADSVGGAALVDLDGDGNLDVVVDDYRMSPTFLHRNVLRGRGDGTFDAPVQTTPTLGSSRFYTRDVNSDGKLDLIGVSAQRIDVVLGNGTLALGTATVIDVTPGGDIGFGDLDGDGALDIVNAYGEVVTVALGHSDGTFASPIPYESGGGAGSITLTDVDRDGRVDIVVENQPSLASILYGRCL